MNTRWSFPSPPLRRGPFSPSPPGTSSPSSRKHVLKAFHPSYNDGAEAQARELGCDDWQALFGVYYHAADTAGNQLPYMRDILGDVRFRKAMSLALDREEINQVVYLGQEVPMQVTPGDSKTVDFISDEMRSISATVSR